MNIIYSCETTAGHIFTHAQHTVTILSIVDVSLFSSCINLIGSVPCKIVNFCLRTPITRSTCIRTSDSSRLQSTSTFSSCFLPFVKGGIFTSAIAILAYSSTVNPLSANTISPIQNNVSVHVQQHTQ